jgi:hypothetical protein
MSPTARLIDPGALLATSYELDDGSRVRLRLTRPTDLPRIHDFLDGAEAHARRLAFYDPRERLAVGATTPGDAGEEIVGIAEVELLEDGPAEVGVFVRDDHVESGLAELLSGASAALSASRRRRAA